jgi:hypothetical protein
MTTIKDMIQAMDQIEGDAKTPELINEASVTVSANAETADEVGNLMRVLALGGVVHNDGSTEELPHMHDEPEASDCGCGESPCGCDSAPRLQGGDIDTDMMRRQLIAMDGGDVEEDYANEPDEEHHSMSDLIKSGDDIHKSKKMHKPAAGGDNPMTAEQTSIKEALKLALEAKKKKPDEDGDGVPDWADKKPGEDDNEDEETKESTNNDKEIEEALQKLSDEMALEGRGRGKNKKLMAGRGRGRGKKK